MDRNPGATAIDLEELARSARERLWQTVPEHLKRLGGILRRSMDGNVHELAEFLEEWKIDVAWNRLEEFRDCLVVARLDLKDLEPAARERLRRLTLGRQDLSEMSLDYRAADNLHCRDCQWFVTAPHDGTENGESPCVNLGTKGIDLACYGFTRRTN